jgi:hypothetical protein
MTDKPQTAFSPRNLSAQMQYHGRGNPPVSHPRSAISNCFPGLEFDCRAVWRRMFEGIVISENNNYVTEAEDSALGHLVGRRLLKVEGRALSVLTQGPIIPGRDPVTLTTGDNPDAVAFMEWSNSIALLLAHQGAEVECEFTRDEAIKEVLPGNKDVPTSKLRLRLRRIFEQNAAGESLPVVAEVLASPGELSQGLCSPWQNDYRECACYYWAASRPDYVNVVPADDGTSRGDNWMQRENTGTYLPDTRDGDANLSYDDLFKDWQKLLRFVVGGVQEPLP